MLIDWSANFGSWLDLLESQADAGQPGAQERLDIVLAQLSYLQELKDPPEADTPTLRRVRQSGVYPVWRVSHPYREGIAIRLIVWFSAEAPPMIILFANDKAVMGDVSTTASAREPIRSSRHFSAHKGAIRHEREEHLYRR